MSGFVSRREGEGQGDCPFQYFHELGKTSPVRFRFIIAAGCFCVAGVIASAQTVGAVRPVAERIAGRSFPSIFQAWSGAGPSSHSIKNALLPRHDLVFQSPQFYGLRWNHRHVGLGTGFTPASIAKAMGERSRLLGANPNMILLAELRYRDAPRNFLPADHPWWLRSGGKRVEGWKEGRFFRLDFANPEFRRHIARQAAALMATGCVDGIMLDWWEDDGDRLRLIQEIRTAIGEKPLVLVNSNDRKIPLTASHVNGLFMECTRTKTPADWQKIAATLEWAERSLRSPRINCLETWWHTSRGDLRLMRLTTTLSAVLSNGYALFSDPNPLPTPDHRHDWYPFWNAELGRPLEAYQRLPNGLLARRFENGVAVCNPAGNAPASLSLDVKRRSWSSGLVSRTFRIGSGDGDFLIHP